MKRLFTAMLGFAISTALAGSALAQANPRGTAKIMVDGKAVSAEYGRPALKGRTAEQLLDQLKPGEVWRLGADKSTTFSTATDLAFGDVTVPKGEYSLWARKEADNAWKLVFNKQHGQWGTDHDAAQDLAAVPLKQEKEKTAEQVTISFEEERGAYELSIQWGDIELSTYFKAK